MANGGRIDFTVGLKTDKNSLNQLNKALWTIQDKLSAATGKQAAAGLDEAAESAKKLQSILNEAWNSKLGQLNLDKVNKGIIQSYGSVQKLSQSLNKAGADGRNAFNQLASEVLHTNLQIKEGNALLNDFADTFGKTVKYGIASSIFNNIKNSLQQAYYFAKDLDLSLTNIRIVTGDSADQMERFSKTANQAAKELGRSTLDYTNAALTFYQQGLGDQEVNARTQATMMAQNITGTGTQMADYLTAVWNGYKVGAEEAVEYVDKLAAVADSSASDMSQLAIAMSKVASAANVMGVDSDQLNAQLATVIATTRQAPESIGTAFKTIYARINDIKAGTDEAEMSLGNYSGKMAELGFNVFDTSGKLRDTGDVIEEIGGRWGELSREQQIYLAQVIGGTRQYSRLISLFDNWNMYTEMLNVSLNSQGTLLEKNDRYMDSVKAHLQSLNAETERTYMILSDTGAINALAETFSGVLNIFNDYIQGLGGGLNVIVNFGSQIVNLFNNQIGKAINQQLKNLQMYKANLGAIQLKEDFVKQVRSNISTSAQAKGYNLSEAGLEKEANIAQKLLTLKQTITQEEYNSLTALQQQIGLGQTRLEQLEKENEEAVQYWGILENSSQGFQNRLTEEQQTLQILQEQKDTITQHLEIYKNLSSNDFRRQQVQTDVSNLLNNQNLSIEQKERLQNILDRLKNKEILDNKDIKEILQVQNTLLKDQENTVRSIGAATSKRKQEEEARARQNAREKLMEDETAQLERQQKIATTIKNITAGVQGLTAIVGGLKTITDQTAATTEKVQASWSAFVGAGSAVANALMPGSGFIVQGIAGLVKNTFELTGIWDNIIHHFETAQEALARINKNQQEVNNSRKEYVDAKKELQGIREDYQRLSKKSGEFTDEEKTRWNEIASVFEKYNSDVVLGYDEQGQAILSKNAKIDDTISKLQDEYDQIIANKLAMQDLSDYDKPYKQAVERVKDAQLKVTAAKYQVNSKLIEDEDKNKILEDYGNLARSSFIKFSQLSTQNEDFQKAAQNFAINWSNATQVREITEALSTYKADLQELLKEIPDDNQDKKVLFLRFKELSKYLNKYDTEQDKNNIENAKLIYNNAVAEAKKAGQISAEDVWNNIFSGQNFLHEKKKLTTDQWESYGEGSLKDAVTEFVNDANETFNTAFDEAITMGLNPPQQSLEDIVKEADKALAGMFDGMHLDEVDAAKNQMLKQLQKKTNDNIEDSVTQLNKIRTDAAQKLYDIYSKQSKEGSNGDFIRYVVGEALGVEIDKEGNITTKQLQAIQDTIQSAIDGINSANVNAGVTNLLLGNSSEESIQSFRQAMLAMSEETFNDFVNWLDTADLKGKFTFDELLKAYQKFKDGVDKKDLEETLDFDDIVKTIEKLSKGDSINSIAKGEATKYVKYLMRTQEDLREVGLKYGINSKQFAEAMSNLELEKQQKKLEKQNEELDKLKSNLEDLNNQTGAYKDYTGSELHEKRVQLESDIVDSELNIAETQGKINQLTEQEVKNQTSLLDIFEQKKQAFDNVKEAYEKMWKDDFELNEKESAALDELSARYSNLAQVQSTYGRGSVEYLTVLKQILALQQQRLKTRQESVGNLQTQLQSAERQLQELNKKRDSATDPQYIQFLDKKIERLTERIEKWRSKLEELGLTEEDISEIMGLNLDGLEKKYEKIGDQIKGFGNYYQKLTDGVKLSKEEYGDLTDLLDAIKQKYSDLSDVVDRVSQTWQSGSEQYAIWVEELQNSLYAKFIEEAFEQTKADLKLPVSIQIDDQFWSQWEATKEDIENFFKDDRELSIRIDDALNHEFDQMKNNFNQIYEAASKIGQNFIVAAEDIKEIEKVFPSITQGMALLANGSFQLNKDMVQQAMNTADAEVNASAQAMMDKVQNDIDYHNAKADIYAKIKDLAYQMAGDEVMSQQKKAETIGQISDANSQLLEINKQKVVQYQQKSDDNLVKSTDVATDDMSNSFIEYYEGNAQASAESTIAQIDHMSQLTAAAKEMQAGLDPAQRKNFITSNMGFLGHLKKSARKQTGQVPNAVPHAQAFTPPEVETFDSSSPFLNFTKQDWLRYAQQAGIREDQQRAIVQILQGTMSEIQGRANKVLKGLDNVAQGYGIDGPKEEKQKQPAKPDNVDLLKEEFDIYHDINIILSKIERSLKRVQSEEEKLVGIDLANNYQQQLDILNQQIAAQKTKIEIGKGEAAMLQGLLASQGVAFNGDGTIANYLSVLQSKENEVNSFISYYNSLSKEQQEAAKSVLDSVKQEYEDLKKNIQKYDNVVNEMIPDLEDQIKEQLDKKVEITISKFKMSVDMKINLSQLTRDYNNFVKTIKKQIREDNILGNTAFAFKDLESYFLDGISNSTAAQANHIKQTIQQIYEINQTGMSDIYGNNKAQALKDLQEYRKNLQGDLTNILELINQIKENVIKAIEQVNEGFKNREKYYNHISDLLDHDLKMVQLIYGDKAYQKMDVMYKAQYSYDIKHLAALKEQKQYWEDQLRAEKAHQDTLEWGSQAWHESEQRIKKFEDYWMEATKNLNSEFERSVQNIISEYENGIKIVFSDIQKELSGGFEFDKVKQDWELVKKQSDMHFDNINKMYQLQKLGSQFESALSQTKGNVKAQKELNALMQDQLQSLQKNQYLREYDVKRANKILEIEKETFALEEARNNKSTLTLKRDSQGNYSYQYGSDMDDIEDRLQKIRDLKNELYNLDLDQVRADQDEFMQLFQDWQRDMTAASQLGEEQRGAVMAAIDEKYRQMVNENVTTYEHAKANLAKSTLVSMQGDYFQLLNPNGTLSSLYSDDSATVREWTSRNHDEIDQALDKINELYGENSADVAVWQSDNFSIVDRTLKEIQAGPYTNLRDAFESMINDNSNGMVPIWNNGMSRMMDKIAGSGGFEPIAKKAMDGIKAKTLEYETQLDSLALAADVDLNNIGQGITDDITLTEQLKEKNDELLGSYQDIYNEMMSYWIPTLENFILKHEALKSAIDAIAQAYRLQREEYERNIKAMEAMATAQSAYNASLASGYNNYGGYTDYGSYGGYNSGAGYGGYESGAGLANGFNSSPGGGAVSNGGGIVEVFPTASSSPQPMMQIYLNEDKVRNAYNAINTGSVGNDPYRTGNLQNMGYTDYGAAGQNAINNAYLQGMSVDDAIKKASVVQIFDTGGYTGNWNGTDGRLAFLHQKELVLNATDTQNMLAAINIVRGLNDQLNNLTSQILFNEGRDLFANKEVSPFQQNVHITADFPAVRDYRQIEMAFQNLLNRASQYLFTSRYQ